MLEAFNELEHHRDIMLYSANDAVVAPKDVLPIVLRDPTRELFQQMLFSKIVPNCKKLGLLDRNDSWLRHQILVLKRNQVPGSRRFTV